MVKTREEKAEYCRTWRQKNRESYLKRRRENYQKNIDKYREKSKERACQYYKEVLSKKRKENPAYYKALERERAIRKKQKKNAHLRHLRELLGGECSHCTFKEDIDILQFHHHNNDKFGNVSSIPNYQKREEEAKKCILLCPNCHAIEHKSNDNTHTT